MGFKVNDRVSWKSYLGTIEVIKTGEIVSVLEPGENLKNSLEFLIARFGCYPIWNEGDIRDNKSYAVLMKDGSARPRLYLLNEVDLTRVYKISTGDKEIKVKLKRRGRKKK